MAKSKSKPRANSKTQAIANRSKPKNKFGSNPSPVIGASGLIAVTNDEGRAMFVGQLALGSKPTMAVLDTTGIMQFFEYKTFKELKKSAGVFEKHGFKVLVGLSS